MSAIKQRCDAVNRHFLAVGAKDRSFTAMCQQNKHKGIRIAMTVRATLAVQQR